MNVMQMKVNFLFSSLFFFCLDVINFHIAKRTNWNKMLWMLNIFECARIELRLKRNGFCIKLFFDLEPLSALGNVLRAGLMRFTLILIHGFHLIQGLKIFFIFKSKD